MGVVSSIFTNNSKKWRDMGKQLEMALTLFFWWLGVEISFLPTMRNHMIPNYKGDTAWQSTVNKVIVAIFVGVCLNLAEKIIIQLIAISFHLRTYADRIEINKFNIGSLVKLYTYSKQKITEDDSDFEGPGTGSRPGSGARTPMQYVEKAQKNVAGAFQKAGDLGAKVAGDFTGKQVVKSTHPHQVVLMLLHDTEASQVLARRLYRTFVREGEDTVDSEDLRPAFDNDEEAEAAFTMFDKDLNGDITMEELESVCVEIGRERKGITASLKDLDSVIGKFDNVLMFIVAIITILVFITLISTSAAGVLTSLGGSVLALSWLFSATAQEFLQSIVFVFVKHPFDVGDRVTIYGNTGTSLQGDDYYVKEISLLYTEFKKMEGHVVQAPNSYLNTLFILNMRRSGGLAEAVPLVVKFGTTIEQIDELRRRLLEFVRAEKREFQNNILTEVRQITEAYSLSLNVVFFYKSNWQNELLRLQRRNKFICALMTFMIEIEIEGPYMRTAGQKPNVPFYVAGDRFASSTTSTSYGPGHSSQDPDLDIDRIPAPAARHQGSILRRARTSSSRQRGESVSAMAKRVDFSLGMKDVSSSDIMGDVFADGERRQAVKNAAQCSPSHESVIEEEVEARKSESRAEAEADDEKAEIRGKENLHRQGNENIMERGGA